MKMKTTFPHSLTRLRTIALAWIVPLVATGLVGGCASSGTLTTRPVSSERGTDTATDLRIAQSALEGGDTQLAVTLFDKVLKASPQSTPARLGLADAIYQTGDLARAGVLYAGVAAQAPGDPQAQLGLARVALRERRLDEATEHYRALLAAHPGNAVASEGLGTALDLQGRHAEAQAIYRAALQQHPEAQGLRANLGLSLILARQAREGANVLLDIAGLPDAPPQARQNLALAYGLLGNDEAAKRILLADLPVQSAEDNLQFYQNVRARLVTASGDNMVRVAPVPIPVPTPAAHVDPVAVPQ